MLEKYLNKQVIVEEKLYNSTSTVYSTTGFGQGLSSVGMTNILTGLLTGIDDEYIELDNNAIILRKHIYRIRIKN